MSTHMKKSRGQLLMGIQITNIMCIKSVFKCVYSIENKALGDQDYKNVFPWRCLLVS
jgi:hypothetical protein